MITYKSQHTNYRYFLCYYFPSNSIDSLNSHWVLDWDGYIILYIRQISLVGARKLQKLFLNTNSFEYTHESSILFKITNVSCFLFSHFLN